MAENTNYQRKYAKDFKNILKSYNINIDTERAGGYWDVTANATGAVASQIVYYLNQISEGNNPYYASSFMLEEWASSLGLPARKTGLYASGLVELALNTYPLDVSIGQELTLGNFKYTTLENKTITAADNQIEIEAVEVGAEYNLGIGVVLQSPYAGTATSQGIYGGSGRETDLQLLSRILENVRFRRTACMVSDYIQKALEDVNYASGEVLFAESVVPYGINMVCANTVNDFELASEKSTINEIALHTEQINELKNKISTSKSVGAILQVGTINTQVVTGVVINVTSSDSLTSANIDYIEKQVRIAIMKTTGDYLYRYDLYPDIKDVVTSYYFNSFAPIERTSPMMDCIDITVNEV